jgi:hypothetical protein
MLCSGYPTQLSLVMLMTSMGMSIRTTTGGLTPSFVFILSLVDAVLVVSLVCLFIKSHGESVRQVLTGDRPILREALVGIVLIPLVFTVVVLLLGLILALVPKLHNVPLNPLAAMVQTPRDAIIFSIVVMVAGGVREEVQRGFIIHRFDQHLAGRRSGSRPTASLSAWATSSRGGTRRWPPGCSARSGAASTSLAAASWRPWSATPGSICCN